MKAIRTKGIVQKANVTCYAITPSDDFVLSGFSASKYVTLPDSFSPENNTWEMVFKITTAGVSGQQQFLGGIDSQYAGVEAAVEGGKFEVWIGSSTSSSYNIANGKTGTYTVLANTTYWVKIAFDGSVYTLAYSLNGKDYTIDITVSSTVAIASAKKALGLDKNSADYIWTGSIDLKECYININGERWWSGVKDVQVDRYLMAK